MNLSTNGYVVNTDGSTTSPMKSSYWIGDNSHRVCFDFLLMDDGYVALHSIYGCVDDHSIEEFKYDVVTKVEVLATAFSVVKESMEFLTQIGVTNPAVHIDAFFAELQLKICN